MVGSETQRAYIARAPRSSRVRLFFWGGFLRTNRFSLRLFRVVVDALDGLWLLLVTLSSAFDISPCECSLEREGRILSETSSWNYMFKILMLLLFLLVVPSHLYVNQINILYILLLNGLWCLLAALFKIEVSFLLP